MHQIDHNPMRWQVANNFLNAQVEKPIRSRIITPATKTTAEVVLRNTGSAVWKPGEVHLELVGGESFGLERSQPITTIIKPSEAITLTLEFDGPAERGAYPSRWRLARGTTYFGPEIVFGLVVLPASEIDPEQALEDPVTVLQAILDKFVTDTQERVEEELNRLIAELRRQIIEQFWRAVCGVVPGIVIIGTSVLTLRRSQRRRQAKECGDE